jgi:hypothetical protein
MERQIEDLTAEDLDEIKKTIAREYWYAYYREIRKKMKYIGFPVFRPH